MGLLGKLLVLAFGAGSLLCLTFGIAINTQRLDFVTPKGVDAKKQVSLLEKSQARTRDLLTANNRAFTRWRQEYDDLVAQEISLYQRREFYRGQLELIQTGKFDGKDIAEPIQELGTPEDATGLLKIDAPTGRKAITTKAGAPAKPKSVYEAGIKAANDQMGVKNNQGEYISGVLKDIADLTKQNTEADVVINGRELPFVKGLRTYIKEQEQIEADAIAEALYLEHFLTNRRAEANQFIRLRNSLEARVKELVEKNFKPKDGSAGNSGE